MGAGDIWLCVIAGAVVRLRGAMEMGLVNRGTT